jgi:hypothetical protein
MPVEVTRNDLVSFGALVAALAWLTFRPISIPCMNCDTGGLLYKCAEGTGLGSITCDAYMAGESAVGRVATVAEYAKDLTLFASKLPQYLANFATALKVKLLLVGSKVYKRLQSVWAMIYKKLEAVRELLSKPLHDAWDTVYSQVIQPIIASVIKYILEPVTELIDSVAAFVGTVIKEVKKIMGESQDIVAKAYHAVYDASGQVSATVEKILVDCAELIEKLVTSIRNATNTTLDGVMGGLETSVNAIGAGVNTAIDGLESGVNTVLGGTVGTVNTTVNKLGEAVDTIATGTSKTVNTALSTVTEGVEDSVNKVADGVESAVNVVGANVVGAADSVVQETENIINGLSLGLETSVNTLIDVINDKVGGVIETTVNGSADIVEDAVNTLLKPIKAITSGINKIPAVEISLGKLGSIYPFSFVPTVRAPKNVDFPKVAIPNIDHVDIPDVHMPTLKYVVPTAQTATTAKAVTIVPATKAKALGRERILGAIQRAQKNWRISSGQESVELKYFVEKKRNFAFMPGNQPEYDQDRAEEDEDAEIDEMVESWTHGRRPLGKSIFNKMKDGFNKAGEGIKGAANKVADFAEDTTGKAIDGLEDLAVKAIKPLIKAIQDAQADGAKDALASSAAATKAAEAQEAAAATAIKTQKATAIAGATAITAKQGAIAAKRKAARIKAAKVPAAKIVNGVSIPPVSMTAPTISIAPPGLRVDLKVDGLKIPRPDMKVTLPRPQVHFEVGDISGDVPKVPNLLDGVAMATSKLSELLTGFMKPVWETMATLFAYVNTVIASVMHFFTNELSWSRIKGGVMTVVASAAATVEQKMQWLREEIAVPLYNVMLMLRDRLIDFTMFFITRAKALLKDLKEKLYVLMDAIWVKVKPYAKEAAVISGGIGMLSIGRLVDKLIPLPMTTTSKVYMVLALVVGAVLYGWITKVKFVTDTVGKVARVTMVPFMYADQVFETAVRESKAPMASTLRAAFGLV